MCGIVGLIQKEKPVDPAILTRMNETLRRRGPDDSGSWVHHNVGLAHRRLSILDLSAAGRQPMLNEDENIVLTFNGEIYNAPALRRELQSRHQFRSRTDTEVIIHLYEESKGKLCQQLEGMFAFGLYDSNNHLLTLARDRFGEKPLYYILTDAIFAFASEPKALYAHPDIRAQLRLDQASLAKYFCYGFIPSPHSLYAPLKTLPAATFLQFNVRQWRLEKNKIYWDLPHPSSSPAPADQPAATDRIDQLIANAVADRLCADVPVGIFLSGGLDSSIIAANVVRAGHQLTAFTIAADNPAIDESLQAAQVAQYLGIPHQIVHLTKSDIQTTFLDMVHYLDEPLADAAIFYTAWLARESRRQITVALSGDGGDELFGGYVKYRAQLLAEQMGIMKYLPGLSFLGRTTANVIPNFATFLTALPYSFAARQYLWGSGSPTMDNLQKIMPYSSLDEAYLFAEAEQMRQRAGVRDAINTSLYIDSRILLPDGYLAKSDRATMAASLELRSPLLDTELTEAVTALPRHLKVHGWQGKIILRQIAKKLLPAAVLTHKKMGFGVPFDAWLRGPLQELFYDLICDAALNGIIDLPLIQRYWQEHQSLKRNHQFILLRVGMLAAALRRLPAVT